MAKKNTSFRLSDKCREQLAKLAEMDNRSEANMIEMLVDAEAKRLKISISK